MFTVIWFNREMMNTGTWTNFNNTYNNFDVKAIRSYLTRPHSECHAGSVSNGSSPEINMVNVGSIAKNKIHRLTQSVVCRTIIKKSDSRITTHTENARNNITSQVLVQDKYVTTEHYKNLCFSARGPWTWIFIQPVVNIHKGHMGIKETFFIILTRLMVCASHLYKQFSIVISCKQKHFQHNITGPACFV